MKRLNTTIIVFILMTLTTFSQDQSFDRVIISFQNDYHTKSKLKEKHQILIDYSDSIVYYRKKPVKKYVQQEILAPNFFKDSIDFNHLAEILSNSDFSRSDTECSFRNYGSVRIELVFGGSSINYSRSYEFSGPMNCNEESDLHLLMRIHEECIALKDKCLK